MNCEAIILAGGLGTRLKHLLHDLPKSMANIHGKPFLHYVFQYLKEQKINRAILSVGYKHEQILSYFGNNYSGIEIEYVIEETPLGTGGAIKKALAVANDEVVILNGDTYFPVAISELQKKYHESESDIILSLKSMSKFYRYGTVAINKDGTVKSFEEKKYCKEGLINGGVYYTSKSLIEQLPAEKKFSFENDFMQIRNHNVKLAAVVSEEYFIDIGIPEDYHRAQQELR